MFFNKDKNIILAKNVKIPLTKKIDANVFIYGNEKDGKYESYILPNIYNMVGNYIIIDKNNNIFDKTNQYMKLNGYNIFKYDINNYNTFEYIDWTVDTNITFFSNAIIKNNYDNKTLFNENLTDILFRCIIYYILLIYRNKITISNCIKVLYHLENEELAYTRFLENLQLFINLHKSETALIVNEIDEGKKDLINKFIKILENTNITEIKSVIRNLISILENIKQMDIEKTEFFNLKQSCMQKSVVYINTSDELYLNSMFYTQMMWNLFEIAKNNMGVLPFDTLLILDNFESLGYIFGYDMIISTSRSRHIYHSLIVDDWFKFRNLYNDIWRILMGNISSGVFLRNFSSEPYDNLLLDTNINEGRNIKGELPNYKCIVYQKYKNHSSCEKNINMLQIKDKYFKKKTEKKLEEHMLLNEDNKNVITIKK